MQRVVSFRSGSIGPPEEIASIVATAASEAARLVLARTFRPTAAGGRFIGKPSPSNPARSSRVPVRNVGFHPTYSAATSEDVGVHGNRS